MIQKRVKKPVENTSAPIFVPKIRLERTTLKDIQDSLTTDIDWFQQNLDSQDKIFDLLEKFRRQDPRFECVTSREVLTKSKNTNRVKFNKNYDETIGFFASEISVYFNTKYDEAYKKILKIYNSMDAFNKSKESKDAIAGREYIKVFYEANSFDSVYWNIRDTICNHYCDVS